MPELEHQNPKQKKISTNSHGCAQGMGRLCMESNFKQTWL
jgi:hypothetical protein